MNVCFSFKYIPRVPPARGVVASCDSPLTRVVTYHQDIRGMTKTQFVQNVKHAFLDELLPVEYDIVQALHGINGNDEFTQPAFEESEELMEECIRFHNYYENSWGGTIKYHIPTHVGFYFREKQESSPAVDEPPCCYTCHAVGSPDVNLACYFQCQLAAATGGVVSAATTPTTPTTESTVSSPRTDPSDDDEHPSPSSFTLLLPPPPPSLPSLPSLPIAAAGGREQHLLCSQCHEGFLLASVTRCGICRAPHIV